MEINFKSKNSFYCNFDRHIIYVNSIDDLKLICNLLKKNGVTFGVERGFKNYEICLKNKFIRGYSDNHNCKYLECSLNTDISGISLY